MKTKLFFLLVCICVYGCVSSTPKNAEDASTCSDSVENSVNIDVSGQVESECVKNKGNRTFTCNPDSIFYIDGVEFYHNRMEDVSHLLGCWSWSGEFTELQFFKDKMSWPDSNLGEFYPYYVHGDTIEMPNNVFSDVSYKYQIVGDTMILVDLAFPNNEPLSVVRFNP